MSVKLFELHRAEVAEGGVQALAIEPNLKVFKDRGACQGVCCKLAGDTFRLQGAEEALSDCIVVAVANSAQLDLPTFQLTLVGNTGVLAALIRMMK